MVKVVDRGIACGSQSISSSRCFIFSALFICLGCLVGCVRVSTQTSQTTYHSISPKQRQQTAAKITSWNITGAFSVVRNQKALLANYQWRQSGKQFIIQIAGALNIAATTLMGRPGHVTLRQSAAKVFQASSAEVLMQQQLGWYVPVSYLKYWIRGLSAPGRHKATFDRYGHLIALKQQGWTIDFSKYQTNQGVDLPKMLRLSRPRLRVKLVVKQWHIH